MNIKQSIKLSAIIDKMEIKISNASASKEDVGADLMIQVVSKVHKAEKEIYSFIADQMKITVKEAEDVDLVEFIGTLTEVQGLKSFFTSALK